MKQRPLSNIKIIIGAVIILVVFYVWSGKERVNKLAPSIETTDTLVIPGDGFEEHSLDVAKTHLMLGNPSSATTSVSNSDNYLMINEYFALSYNRSKATANWVAWKISRSTMSSMKREDSYRPDDRLPNSWAKITPNDYSKSGYTRGHLCPSADRDANSESMASTFLMTNMVPQTYDLNAGPWLELEKRLRNLAWQGNDVYVIAGVYGEKGRMKRKMSIPSNNWKIAVVVRSGAGIESINEKTEVIAVDMPNIEGIENTGWKTYISTVRDLENKTGYNFLSEISQQLQDKLEQ